MLGMVHSWNKSHIYLHDQTGFSLMLFISPFCRQFCLHSKGKPHTNTLTAQPWNSNSQLGSFTSIVLSGHSSTHSTMSVCVGVCVWMFPISPIFLLYVSVLCWSHLIECVWNRFSGDKHFSADLLSAWVIWTGVWGVWPHLIQSSIP